MRWAKVPVADLRVEHVDPGGMDVDEHVVIADRRFRRVGGLHRALVLLDEVSLHQPSRNSEFPVRFIAITHRPFLIVRTAGVRTVDEVLLEPSPHRMEVAMKRRHPVSGLVVIAGTALLVAGCGGGSGPSASASSSGSSSQAASGGSASAVKIINFKFAPATVAVEQGARVTVTNQDSTAHTATADDGRSFDTGALAPGASRTISVGKPGSYRYHCSIHPFMHGTLVVK
jgi:plastocyanin